MRRPPCALAPAQRRALRSLVITPTLLGREHFVGTALPGGAGGANQLPGVLPSASPSYSSPSEQRVLASSPVDLPGGAAVSHQRLPGASPRYPYPDPNPDPNPNPNPNPKPKPGPNPDPDPNPNPNPTPTPAPNQARRPSPPAPRHCLARSTCRPRHRSSRGREVTISRGAEIRTSHRRPSSRAHSPERARSPLLTLAPALFLALTLAQTLALTLTLTLTRRAPRAATRSTHRTSRRAARDRIARRAAAHRTLPLALILFTLALALTL